MAQEQAGNLDSREEFFSLSECSDLRAKKCAMHKEFSDKARRGSFKLGTAEFDDGKPVQLVKGGKYEAEGVVNEKLHKIHRRPDSWYKAKSKAANAFINHYKQLRTNFPALCDPMKVVEMKDLIYVMAEMGNTENRYKHDNWAKNIKGMELHPSDEALVGPSGVYNILLAVERLAALAGGYDKFKDGKLLQLRLGKDKSAALTPLGEGVVESAAGASAEDVAGDIATLDTAPEKKERWEQLLSTMENKLTKKYLDMGIATRRRNPVGMERVSYSAVIDGKVKDWVTVKIDEKGFGIPVEKGGKVDMDYSTDPEEAARKAFALLKSRVESARDGRKAEGVERAADYAKAVGVALTTGEFKEKYEVTREVEGSHSAGLDTSGRYVFRVDGGNVYGRLEGEVLVLETIEVGNGDASWKQWDRVKLGQDEKLFSGRVSVALDMMGV
jgi:hypothetical protein